MFDNELAFDKLLDSLGAETLLDKSRSGVDG